jgi:cobalt/nickel transport system permease protein
LHFHALDAYRPRASFVHQLDPRVKLALVVAFVISVALTPEGAWRVYALLAGMALAVGVASQLGVGFVQRRAVVVLPFALAAVTVVFSTPGRRLLAVSLFGWELGVTESGLVRFASILLKSWLSVQMAVVLTASTPFPDLLRAMRDVGFPKVLVAVAGFTYRYIFVIGGEALRMMRARAARSGARGGEGGRSILWRARVTGAMVGTLFLRSIERSERIYDALVSRGYDGEVRSLRPPVLRTRDLVVGSACFLALVGVQVLARWPA